jgi:transcriptional regulator with XRE-family HTH domain
VNQVSEFDRITLKRSKLKQLRQAKRLTLKQLSALSGISLYQLTKFEKNSIELSDRHLHSLMEIFNCLPGDILYMPFH